MSIATKQVLSVMLRCAALAAIPGVAQAADNSPGDTSSGRIYITLQIGANELSQLAPDVATQLQATSNVSFPVCFTYVDSQYVSVSVADLKQGGFSLTGSDGQTIPYQISLGGGSEPDAPQSKVRAINNVACDSESALEVNVSLLPGTALTQLQAIGGKFNFLIKSE